MFTTLPSSLWLSEVTLQALSLPGEIKFELQDFGRGIPLEALDGVFDRFFQVDGSPPGGHRHGAGLGPSIVREIVLARGGRIGLRSIVGRGTTFELVLPLSQRAAGGRRASKTNLTY